MVEVGPDEAQWDAAVASIEAARGLHERGDLGAAEIEGQSALDALVSLLGPDHPDTANAKDTLAAVFYAQGRLREALTSWRAAVATFDKYAGEPAVDPMRRDALRNLGFCLAQTGAFDEALRCLDASLALFEADPDVHPGRTAMLHNFRGVALKLAGRYDEAEAAYARSIDGFRAAKLPIPIVIHHNLSGLACAREDYVAAETHARRAIADEAAQDAPGADLDMATHLCGLGDALAGQSRLREAVTAYEKALALYARAAPDHVEVAYGLHNLGDALSELGDAAGAERCYRDSVRRKEAAGAADHEVAGSLANLAALLASAGRSREARTCVRRAVKLVRSLPKDHPVREGCESLGRSIA